MEEVRELLQGPIEAKCVNTLYDFALCKYPWFVVAVFMSGWQGVLTCSVAVHMVAAGKACWVW
jgi:hypothetical protein